MTKRTSNENIEKIQTLYRNGMSTLQISEETGISKSTCWKYALSDYGDLNGF